MDNFGIVPKIDSLNVAQSDKIDHFTPYADSMRISRVNHNDEDQVSFKDMMVNSVKNLNDSVTEPQSLLREAMVNKNVDVHHIMLATNKAEMNVTIATQLTTKFIQAYEKIMSIQV